MDQMQPNATSPAGSLRSAPKLLLVEDDTRLCKLVKDYLEPMGYEVWFAHNGSQGLETALREPFDAIILDVMLPGLDGFEVLKRLRMHSSVPVLMLTGRGEESDRIVGLELGADDYLPKTFSTRELLARLRAVLRRATAQKAALSPPAPKQDRIVCGQLVLDLAAYTAALGGEMLTLTRQEFEILASLARSAGRVKTREQLLLEVAERDFEVFDRSIDVHVSSLRKKLNDDPKEPRFIETIRGVGYRFRSGAT